MEAEPEGRPGNSGYDRGTKLRKGGGTVRAGRPGDIQTARAPLSSFQQNDNQGVTLLSPADSDVLSNRPRRLGCSPRHTPCSSWRKYRRHHARRVQAVTAVPGRLDSSTSLRSPCSSKSPRHSPPAQPPPTSSRPSSEARRAYFVHRGPTPPELLYLSHSPHLSRHPTKRARKCARHGPDLQGGAPPRSRCRTRRTRDTKADLPRPPDQGIISSLGLARVSPLG